jgi:hypothetical protein
MDPLLASETGDGNAASKFTGNLNKLKEDVKKNPKTYAEYAARWLLFLMYAALAVALLVVTSQ